jgi:hypothetical protein
MILLGCLQLSTGVPVMSAGATVIEYDFSFNYDTQILDLSGKSRPETSEWISDCSQHSVWALPRRHQSPAPLKRIRRNRHQQYSQLK